MLGGSALAAVPGHAASAEIALPLPAATAPAAAASTQVVPPNCATADAELTRRLQPAFAGDGRLPRGMSLGDALASLYKARALCKEGAAGRGMLVYIRLSDALTDPTAQRP